MSLHVMLTLNVDVGTPELYEVELYSANITHNLGEMATEALIYHHLWRPEEIGVVRAAHLITPLEVGLVRLLNNPKKYKKFDSPNGWGTYKHFVPFVADYLKACKKYPKAKVSVCR